jgi:glycosyltransferase involved in cell wall biosynthesis
VSADRFDVVIPTIGRPSLARLLEAIDAQERPVEGRVIVVDDRRDDGEPLGGAGGLPGANVTVLRGPAAGPAAARNAGWRASTAPWVAFLDDDVVPPPDWTARLAEDLERAAPDVAATQGRIRVPLPPDRRPTDRERNVAGLERARWATADIAYRRRVLEEVGGFDERFADAYREDADLGLRVVEAGHRIVTGGRRVDHPVGPADPWVSVRLQRGNAADPLMRAIHGPGWRARAGVAPGRRPRHVLVVTAGLLAIVAAITGRRAVAAAGAAGWLLGTAELAWARIAPGPRDPREVATMAVTSAALPWAAVGHWTRGLVRAVARGPRTSAGVPWIAHRRT